MERVFLKVAVVLLLRKLTPHSRQGLIKATDLLLSVQSLLVTRISPFITVATTVATAD
jgi:hypothetical protein